MCDQNSKIASLGRFVMPVLRGAAAGAAAAPPPAIGLSAPSGLSNFFRGFGAAGAAQERRDMLEQQLAAQRFQQGQQSVQTNLAIEAARNRDQQAQIAADREKRLADAAIATQEYQRQQAERALLSPTTFEEGGQEYRGVVNKETGLLKPVVQDVTKPTGLIPSGARGIPMLATQTSQEKVKVPKKQGNLSGESLLRYMAAQGDESAKNAVAQKDTLAKARIEIAQRRADLAAQSLNLPRGTVYPELDNDGNMTGKFVQVDPRTQRITVFESEGASGTRIKPQTDASKNREKALSIVGNMIQNIRKASNGLQNGENIAENMALLNSQMATFGQVARGLSGEVGVLTDQDVKRVQTTIPGVFTSLAAGYNDFMARYVATQIQNMDDILQKVEKAQHSGRAKKNAPITPAPAVNRPKYDAQGNRVN